MAFYLRKSVKAGPFRFNFSKSGMGLSVGVRGLRFGTGPRGHYVSAGAQGFYYRATVGNKSKHHSANKVQPKPSHVQEVNYDDYGVRFSEIDSANVDGMRESSANAIIDDLSQKSAKIRYSKLLFWSSCAIFILTWVALQERALILTPFIILAYFIGKWLDSFLRVAVVMYDLDEFAQAQFKSIVDAFILLSKSEKIWHIPLVGKIETQKQWKQNAGASSVVRRKDIRLNFGLPNVLRCNLKVPYIPVGNQALYFFPDFLMVIDGKKVGGVNYSDLQIKIEKVQFIEDGRVPNDATVVGKRWLHPNKSGGPDKRFAKNSQLPVCIYEDVLFESSHGVRELITFSKVGLSEKFRHALGVDYV